MFSAGNIKLAFAFLLLHTSLNAQVFSYNCLDMESIHGQGYLVNSARIDCDSIGGVTVVQKICANLELQRQDSLLHLVMEKVIEEGERFGDSTSLKAIYYQDTLWQNYMCNACGLEFEGSIDAIMFMRCMARFIRERREFLEYQYGFD